MRRGNEMGNYNNRVYYSFPAHNRNLNVRMAIANNTPSPNRSPMGHPLIVQAPIYGGHNAGAQEHTRRQQERIAHQHQEEQRHQQIEREHAAATERARQEYIAKDTIIVKQSIHDKIVSSATALAAIEYGLEEEAINIFKNKISGITHGILDTKGQSTIDYALYYGQENLVKFLLQENADITSIRYEGRDAMWYAQNTTNPKIRATLIEMVQVKRNVDNKDVGPMDIEHAIKWGFMESPEVKENRLKAAEVAKIAAEQAKIEAARAQAILQHEEMQRRMIAAVQEREEAARVEMQARELQREEARIAIEHARIQEEINYNARVAHNRAEAERVKGKEKVKKKDFKKAEIEARNIDNSKIGVPIKECKLDWKAVGEAIDGRIIPSTTADKLEFVMDMTGYIPNAVPGAIIAGVDEIGAQMVKQHICKSKRSSDPVVKNKAIQLEKNREIEENTCRVSGEKIILYGAAALALGGLTAVVTKSPVAAYAVGRKIMLSTMIVTAANEEGKRKECVNNKKRYTQ